jgi:DNA-binding SARP family transcriptional activator/pimeloyl-ACP methyl ester carboxylesterase
VSVCQMSRVGSDPTHGRSKANGRAGFESPSAADAYSSAVKMPAIRYVHTDGGVSLAYTVFGDGPPLLYAFAGPALSNFEHEWTHPGLVEQYEKMAEHRTVVRFDWRNCGLSTRHVDDVSPGAQVRDLLALQDHLGFEQAALRIHSSASIALRFAATHPDRVSSLILSSPSVIVASPDKGPSVGSRLLKIGAETDWRLFARLFAISLTGWEGPETAWFTALIESADPEDVLRTVDAVSGDDVSAFLSSVQCPVLVVQRREPPNYFFEELDPEIHLADSRLLTRDLRESRLVILEGASMMITSDPASTAAVLDFLRDVDGPRHEGPGSVRDIDRPAAGQRRGTVTILGSVGFVTADGRRVELNSAGQRRLLAALAISGGDTVRAESLGEMLDLGGSALRTALSRLRARIGDDAIATDASGYRLVANIDATRFEQLIATTTTGVERLDDFEAALALRSGAALDEFSHEPWAEVAAARLEDLARVATENHAELLIGLGRSGEAVSALEAFVAANPYRDRPRGLLIQALACEGRQADALRAYQSYRTFLADEVGTEPSWNVRQIERRIACADDDERIEVIEHLCAAGFWDRDVRSWRD